MLYMLVLYIWIFNRTGGMDMAYMLILIYITGFHTLINIILSILKYLKFPELKFTIVDVLVPPLLLLLIFWFNDAFFDFMYFLEKIFK